jgi:hypothetical protein
MDLRALNLRSNRSFAMDSEKPTGEETPPSPRTGHRTMREQNEIERLKETLAGSKPHERTDDSAEVARETSEIRKMKAGLRKIKGSRRFFWYLFGRRA